MLQGENACCGVTAVVSTTEGGFSGEVVAIVEAILGCKGGGIISGVETVIGGMPGIFRGVVIV